MRLVNRGHDVIRTFGLGQDIHGIEHAHHRITGTRAHEHLPIQLGPHEIAQPGVNNALHLRHIGQLLIGDREDWW